MVKLGWGTPTHRQPRARPDPRHPAAGVRHHRRAARRAPVPGRAAPRPPGRTSSAASTSRRASSGSTPRCYDSRAAHVHAHRRHGGPPLLEGERRTSSYVGGFHPAFTPPPMGLGSLQRLGIDDLRRQPAARAETYFAITSNTVQFGAKAELYCRLDSSTSTASSPSTS